MSQTSIVCGPPAIPFCSKNIQAKYEKPCEGLRITLLVVAALTLLMSALILIEVPGLSQLGTTGGWSFFSAGFVLMFVAVSLRCVKDQNQTAQQTIAQQHQAPEIAPEDTKTDQSEKPKLTDEQQKILNEFTPEMVEALGGVDKVLAMPVLENWEDDWNFTTTAPVMRGYHRNGCFLLFSFVKYNKDVNAYVKAKECLLRKANGWMCDNDKSYLQGGELSFGNRFVVKDHSDHAKHMLNKIRRLIKDEPVGIVQPYIFDNNNPRRPTDAYLEGHELTQFMTLEDVNYYERKPQGKTDIYMVYPI